MKPPPPDRAYGGPPNTLRPSAAAVIFDDAGRLLLQERGDNGYWGLPGGSVELGETIEAAVVREVCEETGYDVTVVRLIGVYSDPLHTVVNYADGNRVQYVNCLFECRITGGAAALSDETRALGWFAPDALPDPFVPNHVIRVQDALARQAAAFYR
ncbi:MAG TPA: NUDIX domain-containing protein [Chloroflexia bacterium]|nr:NUDIX domain-containing protein [Chloroflexia bacterium]